MWQNECECRRKIDKALASLCIIFESNFLEMKKFVQLSRTFYEYQFSSLLKSHRISPLSKKCKIAWKHLRSFVLCYMKFWRTIQYFWGLFLFLFGSKQQQVDSHESSPSWFSAQQAADMISDSPAVFQAHRAPRSHQSLGQRWCTWDPVLAALSM